MSIRTCKLALRMVKILMEDFSIGLDRDAPVLAIADCDAALFAGADVVVGGV